MREPIEGDCSICDSFEKVRHFEIFTSGSEGTLLCHACEMFVVRQLEDRRRNFVISGIAEKVKVRWDYVGIRRIMWNE